MNQAELVHLVSTLRVKLGKPRKLANIMGYRGMLQKLRLRVTALIVNERLEMSENAGILTRQYTERLISDAVTHGPRHKHTMEMAQWWLSEDTAAVHKLFKVLVPRYQDYTTSYTRMLRAPSLFDPNRRNNPKDVVLLELRGHPFPPLEYPNTRPNPKLIHNVLLAEAKKGMMDVPHITNTPM